MTQVILNHDQASAVRSASGIVEILDESGILVGYVTRHPLATEEKIALAQWLRTRPVSEKIPTTAGQFVGKFSREETYADD